VSNVSQVFFISPAGVLVVDDITESAVSEDICIITEKMPVKGDFLLKLSIYLLDSKLERFNFKAIARKFCSILSCQCLISDDSVNPYSMFLVKESKDIQLVYLEPEQLDENEEYIILTSLPGQA
jgi:hypothetical protein